MRYGYLNKADFKKFVEGLIKKQKVVAPVKKENQLVFAQVEDASQVSLDYIPTILPPKKYFMPQHQKLGDFNMGEAKMSSTQVDVEPLILFGVRTCDIEGIECLDVALNDSPADPYFAKKKKSIIIIGYECMKPCDEYATCVAMDTHVPKAGYDIMLTDAGDKYIVHINSMAGDKLIGKSPLFGKTTAELEGKIKAELKALQEAKLKNFDNKLDAGYKELRRVFKDSYSSKFWQENVGKRCLSCGNCTAVCPTCYCFDIYDTVTLDVTKGTRNRVWDSCQLEEFAEVAGGESFREERSARQRHRYHRKFDYSVKKYNKFFCVGCGRCTRTCMAKISLIDTVNELTKEHRDAKK